MLCFVPRWHTHSLQATSLWPRIHITTRGERGSHADHSTTSIFRYVFLELLCHIWSHLVTVCLPHLCVKRLRRKQSRQALVQAKKKWNAHHIQPIQANELGNKLQQRNSKKAVFVFCYICLWFCPSTDGYLWLLCAYLKTVETWRLGFYYLFMYIYVYSSFLTYILHNFVALK